jgi:hypothetical protein
LKEKFRKWQNAWNAKIEKLKIKMKTKQNQNSVQILRVKIVWCVCVNKEFAGKPKPGSAAGGEERVAS